jgi:hypothetical protein
MNTKLRHLELLLSVGASGFIGTAYALLSAALSALIKTLRL